MLAETFFPVAAPAQAAGGIVILAAPPPQLEFQAEDGS